MKKKIKEYIPFAIIGPVVFFLIQFFSGNDRELIEALGRTGIFTAFMIVALLLLAFFFSKSEAKKKDD